MLKPNKAHSLTPILLPLFVSNGFSILLLLCRIILSKKITYLFLSWNLGLAAIPFFIAYLLYTNRHTFSKYIFIAVFPAWLFFYPNAPYIITDLLHLKTKAPLPLWFDVALLGSFAWNGLFLGLLSLYYIEKAMLHYLGKTITHFIILFSILLSGYGIYIGRFMRWNSWDIYNHPLKLWDDVSEPFFNPHGNLKVYAFTFIFAGVTAMLYYLLKAFVKVESGCIEQSPA